MMERLPGQAEILPNSSPFPAVPPPEKLHPPLDGARHPPAWDPPGVVVCRSGVSAPLSRSTASIRAGV